MTGLQLIVLSNELEYLIRAFSAEDISVLILQVSHLVISEDINKLIFRSGDFENISIEQAFSAVKHRDDPALRPSNIRGRKNAQFQLCGGAAAFCRPLGRFDHRCDVEGIPSLVVLILKSHGMVNTCPG